MRGRIYNSHCSAHLSEVCTPAMVAEYTRLHTLTHSFYTYSLIHSLILHEHLTFSRHHLGAAEELAQLEETGAAPPPAAAADVARLRKLLQPAEVAQVYHTKILETSILLV